jgi:hypothetical protein
MLQYNGVHFHFQVETIHAAIYIFNRKKICLLNGITPFEVWRGTKPFVTHIHIFGSASFVHVPKVFCKKLELKVAKVSFLVILMKIKPIKFGILRNVQLLSLTMICHVNDF